MANNQTTYIEMHLTCLYLSTGRWKMSQGRDFKTRLTEPRADTTQPELHVEDGTNPGRHSSTEELVPKGQSSYLLQSSMLVFREGRVGKKGGVGN